MHGQKVLCLVSPPAATVVADCFHMFYTRGQIFYSRLMWYNDATESSSGAYTPLPLSPPVTYTCLWCFPTKAIRGMVGAAAEQSTAIIRNKYQYVLHFVAPDLAPDKLDYFFKTHSRYRNR